MLLCPVCVFEPERSVCLLCTFPDPGASESHVRLQVRGCLPTRILGGIRKTPRKVYRCERLAISPTRAHNFRSTSQPLLRSLLSPVTDYTAMVHDSKEHTRCRFHEEL